MGQIVVGVDGSERSRQALQWAAMEAVFRAAALDVIHTYEPPKGVDSIGSVEQAERVLNAPRQAAQALLAGLVGELEGVKAEAHAIESTNAARTLVEHSRGADMLVVSSRGLGGFRSLMLGSVSQQCAHHAECPVVIVRSNLESRPGPD